MKHFTFVFALFITAFSYAQTKSISILDTVSCYNNAAQMQVVSTDLLNVGAITLHITYKPEELVFDSISNIPASLTGLLYNDVMHDVTGDPIGLVAVSWSSTNALNLGTDTVFTLNFLYQGIESEVALDTLSEIADVNANVVAYDLNNGMIRSESTPTILNEPTSEYSQEAGNNVAFVVVATETTAYQWQIMDGTNWNDLVDDGHYIGTTTNILQIQDIAASDDSTYYRCELSGCVSILSQVAKLEIVWGIEDANQLNNLLQTFPNPVSKELKIDTEKIKPGTYVLTIHNNAAQVAFSQVVNILSNEQTSIDVSSFPAGNYFLSLNSSSDKKQEFRTKFIVNR